MTRHEFFVPRGLTIGERITATPPPAFKRPIDPSEYVRQMVEPNGIHSCFVTAHLNGMIFQNYLTPEEGAKVHDELVTHPRYADRWQPVKIQGVPLKVWMDNPTAISKAVTEIVDRDVRVEAVNLSLVGDREAYLRTKLTQGYAMVVGDEKHAVTAVGYRQPDSVEIIDPLFPFFPSQVSLRGLAMRPRRSDDYVRVI